MTAKTSNSLPIRKTQLHKNKIMFTTNDSHKYTVGNAVLQEETKMKSKQ